jgi:iron-sulfur cluster assembly accessory protein
MTSIDFVITDNAAKRIAFLLQSEPEGTKLRIAVNGGGCSGFKYEYSMIQEVHDDDKIFTKDGAVVVIDEMSLSNFMQGAELNFIQSLSGSEFEIRNPNSATRCGCGNSFSI